MRPLAANVRDLQEVGGAKLVADLKIPVLNVCVGMAAIGRKRYRIEDRIGGKERRRNRILNRRDWIRGRICHGDTASGRRVQLQNINVVKLTAEIEDSIAGANDRVWCGTVGQADAGTDVVPALIPKRIDDCARTWVERRRPARGEQKRTRDSVYIFRH